MKRSQSPPLRPLSQLARGELRDAPCTGRRAGPADRPAEVPEPQAWVVVKPPDKEAGSRANSWRGGGGGHTHTHDRTVGQVGEANSGGSVVPKSRARALTPVTPDLPRRHTQLSCQSTTSLREGREYSPGASPAARASLAPAQCPGRVHDKRASVSTPLL